MCNENVTEINTFDKLAARIFEQNKKVGWWDDMNRCIFQTLQLVSTEIAEATEGERKNLMDDHLSTRKMGEVELADALIRLLDLAGRYDWKYKPTVTPHTMLTSESSIGRQHFACNMALCNLGTAIYASFGFEEVEHTYSIVVKTILHTASYSGYDIMNALYEKLEYNKTRTDHTREAMAEEHGKKF